MSLLGLGAYTFGDAAQLTGLKRRRVREWFRAHPEKSVSAVFRRDFEDETSEELLSFLDLVDVFVAGQLRQSGLALQTLRRVYQTLQQDFGVEHAFSRRELLTDGKQVFLSGLDRHGRNEVVEVLTRQKAFPKIILPFLKRLEFDGETNMAMRWRIAEGVVLDPQICFGKPIVTSSGIPTYVLAQAMKVNQDAELVANWYGVTPRDVAAAIAFETRRAA